MQQSMGSQRVRQDVAMEQQRHPTNTTGFTVLSCNRRIVLLTQVILKKQTKLFFNLQFSRSVIFNTTLQNHQFFGAQLSSQSNCHIHTFSSVQFSCSVMSNSLQPHESQHTRPPCSSPSPGVHSDSRPSSQ